MMSDLSHDGKRSREKMELYSASRVLWAAITLHVKSAKSELLCLECEVFSELALLYHQLLSEAPSSSCAHLFPVVNLSVSS